MRAKDWVGTRVCVSVLSLLVLTTLLVAGEWIFPWLVCVRVLERDATCVGVSPVRAKDWVGTRVCVSGPSTCPHSALGGLCVFVLERDAIRVGVSPVRAQDWVGTSGCEL